MSALPQSARAISPQCRPRSWFNAQFLLLRTWCGAPVQWTSLAWLTQSSMELSQQVRDPLGNRFGNLGIRREFAGNGCLNFFDDQVLTRRSQGFSCAVSMGHLGSPVRVGYRTQRSMMYFRSTLGVEMQSIPAEGTLRLSVDLTTPTILWVCGRASSETFPYADKEPACCTIGLLPTAEGNVPKTGGR